LEITDYKEGVNKEQKIETDGAASRGGQGKHTKYGSFFGLSKRQHCQFLNLTFLVKN
jgi:hypothetical protein